jgi:hypothetical protein
MFSGPPSNLSISRSDESLSPLRRTGAWTAISARHLVPFTDLGPRCFRILRISCGRRNQSQSFEHHFWGVTPQTPENGENSQSEVRDSSLHFSKHATAILKLS